VVPVMPRPGLTTLSTGADARHMAHLPVPGSDGTPVGSAAHRGAPDPSSGVAECAGQSSFTLNERGRIAIWTRAAEELYGFRASEVVGRHPTMLVPPELDLERDELVREVLSGRPVPRYETERMHKDGTRLDVTIALGPVREATGRIVGASVLVRAARPSRPDDAAGGVVSPAPGRGIASQRRLAEAQERFRIAFMHAPNGIALISTAAGSEGCFLDANPALARQLGYESDDLIGRCLLDFLHPAAPADDRQTVARLLEASAADARADLRFLRADGADVWLQISASGVRDDLGRRLYAVAHLQDVTDARRHAAELRHLADHDALTGLVNRRSFRARLEAALADAREGDRPAAVLVADLDGFKGVNDTYGHAVGDDLLRRVATALRSRVRAGDVVARLGGDEFGILLRDVSAERAGAVAAELLAAVEGEAAVSTPDGDIRVTASIGVSTLDASTRASGATLLSDADTAMYEAKRAGRNRFMTGTRRERPLVDPRRRRGKARSVCPADLELWEQPLLHLATGATDRLELFVRMRGRRGEAIPARRFLPALKRSGRVEDIDSWVLAAGVDLAARRTLAGLPTDVEINVDATSITDERFVDSIHSTLAAASVEPSTITFAVTAAASVADVASARRLMSSLTGVGCHFALDHFDGSASSLRDLRRLPFDMVKIDGELIAELGVDSFADLAVRAMSTSARGSGLTTAAEHVCDDATLTRLRELGVDYAQGFHIALPRAATLPGDVFAAA
jgi:diguanylate cyclase (GGDEF)-like protein/PAS domain S-box-containing protein